jgi:hypothetical protein
MHRITATALLALVACSQPAPPPVMIPVLVPTPATIATPAPTTAPVAAPVHKARKPPEPIPPAPPGSKPDLVVRDIDLVGETVTFDLVNRGGDVPAAFGIEVSIESRSGVGRTMTIDESIPAGMAATTSVPHQIVFSGLMGRFPQLALEGGDVDISVQLDTARTIDESDERNNTASQFVYVAATVAPTPVVENPATPAEPPPPAAPTTAAITFRRTDTTWANVWVDGQIIFEPKNYETEQTVTLKPGAHRVKVEGFMGGDAWSEGTLAVEAGKDLVIGFAEGKPFDVYGDPGSFTPL